MSSIRSTKNDANLQPLGSEANAPRYYSLETASINGDADIRRLPRSLKILLENLLRFEDGINVTQSDIDEFLAWPRHRSQGTEIAFRPSRVLMQDFTGVPAIADLAAMRDAIIRLGGDAESINPVIPVDLVIDHSIIVDAAGHHNAFGINVAHENERNHERYRFLRWGQLAFENFRVVPPGTGICHQVNIEHISQVVRLQDGIVFPDTLVGMDSHTTMANGLSVLGWGVGGIEAEAAMLGQPVSMLIPEVVGFGIEGAPGEGVTSTDIVLRMVEMLREAGVVGKFVEFFGVGLDKLTLEDRATIANMAPEYGATCGFFPTDAETLRYLHLTGRDPHHIALVEQYARAQGLFRDATSEVPVFSSTLMLDLSTVEPAIAGPKRPQDRVLLSEAADSFLDKLDTDFNIDHQTRDHRFPLPESGSDIGHGDTVIAAITSCTNTSNPSVMIAAGLLARNAVSRGLKSKPWVKTSLAPGSQAVAGYLEDSGLQVALDALGFHLVGFGCTTCIGNSGPLHPQISAAIDESQLVVTAVLSGNRNFEGRVHPNIKANYLASPPLVVAYALAGSLRKNLTREPLGVDQAGENVFLRDIWPSGEEIKSVMDRSLNRELFSSRYANVFEGDQHWREISVEPSRTYDWDSNSTYVRNPPYFDNIALAPPPVQGLSNARILALFGDTITTDHISPAGSIAPRSPAALYLGEQDVDPRDYNQYGTRRGNHEVMMRGTFANVCIRNHMLTDVEGGFTHHIPSRDTLSIFDCAQRYKDEETPLVVMAGKEYGTGSSRDWAAKGTRLLGVRAVIAESFERIHRSNLIGMGVLPLLFPEGTGWRSLGITGQESVRIGGIDDHLKPRAQLPCTIQNDAGELLEFEVTCQIDTHVELEYFRHGGILNYVLRHLAA